MSGLAKPWESHSEDARMQRLRKAPGDGPCSKGCELRGEVWYTTGDCWAEEGEGAGGVRNWLPYNIPVAFRFVSWKLFTWENPKEPHEPGKKSWLPSLVVTCMTVSTWLRSFQWQPLDKVGWTLLTCSIWSWCCGLLHHLRQPQREAWLHFSDIHLIRWWTAPTPCYIRNMDRNSSFKASPLTQTTTATATYTICKPNLISASCTSPLTQ